MSHSLINNVLMLTQAFLGKRKTVLEIISTVHLKMHISWPFMYTGHAREVVNRKHSGDWSVDVNTGTTVLLNIFTLVRNFPKGHISATYNVIYLFTKGQNA